MIMINAIGYISGVAGLLVGSPLDVLKVRLQTQRRTATTSEIPKSSSMGAALMKMRQNEGVNIYSSASL